MMLRRSAAALLCLLLGGCALFRPKPPRVNLYARRGVAVLPFANASADPALGAAFAEAVAAQLRGLHACAVTSATTAADAAALGCDVVLRGSVLRYEDAIKPDPPKRIRAAAGESAWKWGRGETCRAAVAASVTLADLGTGAILSARSAAAERALGRWTDLDWPGDKTAPPETAPTVAAAGGPRYVLDRNVARAREEAVSQAVRDLLRDERGAPGWEPPPQKK